MALSSTPSFSVGPTGVVDVRTPSGQTLRVLGPIEEAFYNHQVQAYLDEYTFTNPSDLLDLDRLLFAELAIFRAQQWLAQECDYDGAPIDRTREQRTIKEVSLQISKIKEDLGLNKAARDKAQGESVGAYIDLLKQRAREFGIHRETQMDKALTLVMQLFSIVGAYDRSDKVERGKIGFESEAEIVDWIREVMRPEFDAIDAYFRSRPDGQKYWVKQL